MGGGGWVHPKGANNVAVPGLSFRNTVIDTGHTASVLLCTNGLRKQSSHICSAPISSREGLPIQSAQVAAG